MSIDRLERRLPEVLAELSLPRTPDYIDDLLVRTARMPQRPGWTFLERWLPMSTFSATLSSRRSISLRPVVVLLVLAALLASSLALYFGSLRRTPPLFGPAANGDVLTVEDGTMYAIDPLTGSKRVVLPGPNVCCTGVSPDGRFISYSHLPADGGEPVGISIATLDGKSVFEFPADVAKDTTWFEWAPASDRVLLTRNAGPAIVDIPSGKVTKLDVSFQVTRASWIGATGDILLTNTLHMGASANAHVYRLAAGSTSNPTEVTTLANVVNDPLVSPDGSKFLYFIWGPEPRLQGKIHVYDFAAQTDTAITPEVDKPVAEIMEFENPVWSPDGQLIASEVYTDGPNQIAILFATGGDPIIVGPSYPTFAGGAYLRFSPDGKSVIATYRFNKTTWQLPITGGEGTRLRWIASDDYDWQRAAP